MSAEPFVGTGRDRLRELLDAVVPGDESAAGVPDMARRIHASEFHFSREVRRLTGEPPAALRRRIMLERAAWRLGRGEGVAEVAAAEGWSSPEVFSRAFRRSFGVPPSQVAESGRGFRLPAPNGLHFHPPQSLWIDAEPGGHQDSAVSRLMIDHDIADTAHLIRRAECLTKDQWTQELSPGQVVLEWDGPEPSVGAVLAAIVWTKEVWLASIEGRDQPSREHADPATTPQDLAAHHDDVSRRWVAMVTDVTARGRLSDTVIDALCDPPESFQLFGIVAHVLTYSAHRRGLARAMLARLGVPAGMGDPLDWMRSH
ncbi:helix-turn-helix domain-containing protein [Mycolicibacterium confluentis]|uniref:AraC family transcriptional regulator n=1 Tax=Mycolicibacterium confluentis TaxID=28047 RepID=A0A7I7Y412_9MYCO|nr:helix-turn-helix domain-containing protein [Mycolicibacterium confluentis]BBZ35853.1 AraC family transcriptional regulator [Mycolicibacterium confluentis]